ncbi:MAG: PAS-domain containing protein [Pseudomonadota bacterium]
MKNDQRGASNTPRRSRARTATSDKASFEDKQNRALAAIQLSDIIESLPVSFLICDADDRLVYCNSRFKNWFFPGFEDQIVPGMSFDERVKLFREGPAASDQYASKTWLKQRKKQRINPENTVEHVLGNGRVVRSYLRRMKDGGLVTIHLDISDLHDQRSALTAKSEQMDVLLEAIDQGISMMDRNLNCAVLNSKFVELLEFPEELGRPGTPFEAFIRHNAQRGEYGSGDVEDMVRERVELAAKLQPHCFERTRPDGTVIEIRGNPAPDGGFVTTYTDITKRKKAELAVIAHEKELEAQLERFHAALANMTQGLCMFDEKSELVVCNQRFMEIYNLPPDMAVPGTPFQKIVEHRTTIGVYNGDSPEAYIKERLASVKSKVPTTTIQELNNGRVIVIAFQPLGTGGWVATMDDITELQRAQARLSHMTNHDSLTDLPNRTLFRERMAEMDAKLKRGGKYAILCLDLDRFKSINDSLGHPVGDKLLIAAASRLEGCIRPGDTIARLGGDEFAILQANVKDPGETATLARRICEVVAEPFEIAGHQMVVGASIGIAFAPADGDGPDDLMRNADMALYRAKNDGRGIYRFFEPEMDARMQTRRELEIDMRKALRNGEFRLHYQPLVDLKTDKISGFEALLRWPHPQRGMVSPGEFIPIAEETGLIVALGEWVIQQACKDAVKWPAGVRIAVNLSPAQFRDERLIETAFGALARSKLAANRLELEITENALLDNNESTLKTLHGLRDMGVRIAMDDFGTGYSSLSYLRSFPFDKIKIDGSFVRDLSARPDAAAIVNAVASLSQSLGMSTTAEGVETEEQKEIVRQAGYTEMQGFLFSPAVSAEEVAKRFFGKKTRRKTTKKKVA